MSRAGKAIFLACAGWLGACRRGSGDEALDVRYRALIEAGVPASDARYTVLARDAEAHGTPRAQALAWAIGRAAAAPAVRPLAQVPGQREEDLDRARQECVLLSQRLGRTPADARPAVERELARCWEGIERVKARE